MVSIDIIKPLFSVLFLKVCFGFSEVYWVSGDLVNTNDSSPDFADIMIRTRDGCGGKHELYHCAIFPDRQSYHASVNLT